MCYFYKFYKPIQDIFQFPKKPIMILWLLPIMTAPYYDYDCSPPWLLPTDTAPYHDYSFMVTAPYHDCSLLLLLTCLLLTMTAPIMIMTALPWLFPNMTMATLLWLLPTMTALPWLLLPLLLPSMIVA